MSSIFGHALIGMAVGDNAGAKNGKERLIALAIFAFLAISPDLDYLFLWFLQINVEPRYSHSLLGCVLIGIFGVFLKYVVFKNSLKNTNNILLLLAPITHVILDFFVGVHKNPVFWPFNQELIAFGHGVLPSAGKMDVENFYFWRNLAIEMGILVPLSMFISPTLFNIVQKKRLVFALLICVGIAFGCVGYGLNR